MGVEVAFPVGSSLKLSVDVEDYLFAAKFREAGTGVETASRFQNDLLLSVGLAIPLGGR